MIRKSIPGISEGELLFRDWNWINDTMERITNEREADKAYRSHQQAEDRRWYLQALLICVSAGSGWGSESAFESWEQLYDSSFTIEEREIMEAEKEKAEQEQLLLHRAERARLLSANNPIITT